MATLYQLQEGLVKADQSGNDEDVEVLSSAIRQHPTYQKQGKTALSKGFGALSGDERKQAIAKHTAIALGVKPSELDAERGMGGFSRAQFKAQPTQEDKFKFLEKTYGRENLNVLDIAGEDQFLYRDEAETEGKWRRVDEEGVSLADWTTDLAVFAPEIAGAVVGGAKGASAGFVAGGPVGAILGGAGGAAVGGFAAGAAQDVAVRAASGEDIRFGEIGKRRGLEMVIGAPIDVFTGVGGRIISKSVGKRTVEKAAADLTKQVDDLMTRLDPESTVQLTAAQATNVDASLAQSVRAGIDEGGAEARALAAQRDQIGKLEKILRGEDVADEPIEDVMQSITERQFKLIDAYETRAKKMLETSKQEEALAKKQTSAQRERVTRQKQAELDAELKAMRDQAEAGIRKITKGRQRLESANGDAIRKQQVAGLENTQNTNKELYNEFYRRVDTQQAFTPASKIQKVLDQIDDTTLIPDSPEMRGLNSLRKRVATGEDLTFRELDSFIRDVTDGIRYNKTFGFKQSELNLRNMGKKLDKLRDDAMSAPKKLGGLGAGAEARKAYLKAQSHYKNKVLPFFDGDRKANLSRIAGGSQVAPGARGENVLNRTFATRESVKDAIDSGVNRATLKEAYIEQVVRAADGGQIKVDENVLAALYSNSDKGAKILSDFRKINEALRKGGKDVKVTASEIDKVMDAFEPKAKAKALRAIAEKKAMEAKAKKARQNALIKISKGEMPTPDDIHHLVGDIAKMRPGQIAKLMDRLPSDRARASLRRSAYDSLMEKAGKASAKAQRTGKATDREALWEPDTMYKILNNSAERKQWETLLGKEDLADLEKLNNWLLSSSAITKDMAEGIGRFVTSTGASGTPNVLFVSPQLPRWIGRKILGVVHTSPLTRGMMMRKLKEGKVDEDAVMKLFYIAMGTRRGMDAISDEMAKDPGFSAWVQESSKGATETAPEAP